MKKTIILASVAIATLFAFSSCQKESLRDNGSANGVRTITAEFENNATKTTLNSDGVTPEWKGGDEILILNATNYQYVTLSDGDITNNKITFTTSLEGTLYAVYPATATSMESCPEDEITFTIRTEQDGTFASANICVAKSTEEDETNKDNLIFRNATAVLKITTPADVVKVDVAAANPIAGTVTATFEGNDVKLDTDSLDGKTVSALFSSAHSDNTFYLAAAPVTTGDAAVTCYTIDEHGSAEKDSKDLRRNVIYSMDLSAIEIDEEGGCVAAGTKITMGDGSQKVVEELEMGDVIRTVDHKTGEVSSAPVCFIWKTENASNAFTLTFEDEVEVTVIEEHGFYDKDERKYAFINARNAKDYIGHHFYDADNGRWLELKSCKLSNESVDAYTIVTSGHLNHLSNGMLSMSDGSFKVLANIFEYDSQLEFDADKKAADIEKYGLTPLEKILEYKGFLEADYYDYNLMYLNVAIGKGLTSWDYVKALSDYCEANGIF
ncbi:MAG: hypothetical protein MJZ17_10530 [Bacteroidales bacterium]|nr:hypothetical protein [Bacteroidales bacterium]